MQCERVAYQHVFRVQASRKRKRESAGDSAEQNRRLRADAQAVADQFTEDNFLSSTQSSAPSDTTTTTAGAASKAETLPELLSFAKVIQDLVNEANERYVMPETKDGDNFMTADVHSYLQSYYAAKALQDVVRASIQDRT